MKSRPSRPRTALFLGQTPLQSGSGPVQGREVDWEGEPFYQIANYDRLRPFFMTVVSDADHWLFISSKGGLTAGRGDANHALFPYYTDDKIRDLSEVVGSKTLLRVRRGSRTWLWEPFSMRGQGLYRVQRNLYKNFWGNQLMFEEVNHDLGLTFRYGWANSQQFGFIRRAWLTNTARTAARIEVLDGLQNLMPWGVGSQFNLEYSTLLDAYKQSERVPATGLGLFRLSAVPVDRPEPAEALRTTVVWSAGLKRPLILLSSTQLDRFRTGQPLQAETEVRAEPGAYFVQSAIPLRGGQGAEWMIIADVNQGPSDVARLNEGLKQPARLAWQVLQDVKRGTEALQGIVASADGLQQTQRSLARARHYGNTLFNLMRGGVFHDGYRVDKADLQSFVQNANHELFRTHATFFRRLPRTILYGKLVTAARESQDPQLERICREYLPLTFSRRHGDPSRPWNRFSIATRNPDGTQRLNYEGNWRDIFQNWEALALAFPGYTGGMICRFLNASTADGYNPYRITRNGIDWEVEDPHDPWSHIGYWGDHQIIYLLKLLEWQQRHEPAELRGLLGRDLFAYANVPYRIKPYEALLAEPKHTVLFDHHLEKLIRQRVESKGADGKLMWDKHGRVRLVNLTEKLLVPLLAKLSNFVPGAGIWLNTQRPEWNDANNALVGNGTSMVTLYYLRRYLTFCADLFRDRELDSFALSADVAAWLEASNRALQRHRAWLKGPISDTQRKRVLDALGRAGAQYRQRLYAEGVADRKRNVSSAQLLQFFATALEWINHSIQSNRRPDGLYHAYNLIRFERPDALPIRRLYEMLEGQVAVLSSGHLPPREALKLLKALKRSALYRADQHSYLLYPDRQLPRFVEKNNLPSGGWRRSALLRKLLADGNRQLVEQDVTGRVHFHSLVKNARDVSRILDELSGTQYGRLVKRDAPRVLAMFERLFDHESFTGRSGTFFGYEGLGCIYWHMVSKLLLAAQESYDQAVAAGAPADVRKGLADCYYDIRAGIGDCKSPEVYGAFPMDPYSHTPGQGGARQPGLTGQVKEDVLCRFGELGVRIEGGELHFRPGLLRRDEFVTGPSDFVYCDVSGARCRLRLKRGELAFTYGQVPVLYRLAAKDSLTLFRTDGTRQHRETLRLDSDESRQIFNRTGVIGKIEVCLSWTSPAGARTVVRPPAPKRQTEP
ncbi:MAG: hypothetical protein MUE94_08575 [Verrucomicrobia bacterium]|nr:hypothetical protein [Verrucomicrobiota bacterium]